MTLKDFNNLITDLTNSGLAISDALKARLIVALVNGRKIYSKTIEIDLVTGQTDYPLDKYQSLNGKPIYGIEVPYFYNPYTVAAASASIYSTPPQSPTSIPLSIKPEAIDGAYLQLTNTSNQQVGDTRPLSDFRRDPNYIGNKAIFADHPCIDFTQTKVFYPSVNIPNALAGQAILLVIFYEDVVE